MSDAHQREAAIFDAAMELPPEQRAAYLDQACGDDTVLRHRIDRLLKAEESRCEFLDSPGVAEPHSTLKIDVPLTERSGKMIGRYKLLQQIGEGGCGVVYMAEQIEPVRRRVALKIIKLGMDTKSVIARFEAERQALALMDHPNIAKVFDAGATETGRPYFVMELVRGMKITDYCDEKKLPTDARLDLFTQVCHAIQHAHQKGIIHRDIKPSNVLVTVNDGVAVPKVIDFGVAKATGGQQLTNKTVFTAFEQFIGTPAYMSPEQVVLTSLDIDTRSDIYALGVLLYELLTGRTPFDAKELLAAGLEEMRRTIREAEPSRPSTRVSTLPSQELSTTAHRRGLEAPKLVSELRGDLDWIVMKCLEKDRARRYESANGLAMDIKRHLSDEPVVARPPSKLYEFQKTVRRHKLGFAATAAIILALAGGVVLSTWQASRATREATRANTALNELRETAPAFASQARTLVAAERIDEAIEKLDYAIKLRPDVAEYRSDKANLLMSQLKLAEAAVLYREALRLKPDLAQAEESAQLCDKVLAAEPAADGGPSLESLSELFSFMRPQRSAAELMLVARLLGEEKQLVLDLWLERLKELPIPPEKPLKERLTMHEVGRLVLDLSGTGVTDLEPLRGMPLGRLVLDKCTGIKNLEPLEGAPLRSLLLTGLSSMDNYSLAPVSSLIHLKQLSLSGTKVTDLSPLQELPLEWLDLTGTLVDDLTPLRGMQLKYLTLRGTRVADLSPLKAMPITELDATYIPAFDFSPLAGAPLETCHLQFTAIRDLSFLRGSPLRELTLTECRQARGYAVLEGLKSLNRLILPISYRNLPAEDYAAIGRLRNSPALKNIDTMESLAGTGKWQISSAQSADEFWKEWDHEEVIISHLHERRIQFVLGPIDNRRKFLRILDQPLRDLSFLKDASIDVLVLYGTEVTDLSPLENLPLAHLDIRRTPVSDLSPLRSPVLAANLEELLIWQIPATDFSPLSNCIKLEYLDAVDTALENLDALRGLKLRVALLSGTKVTDLSALSGMPLRLLTLARTSVTDISPLLQCPTLMGLVLPPNAHEVESLRFLPQLQRLSFVDNLVDNNVDILETAADFWLEHDHGGITAETVSTFLDKSVQNPQDTILAMKVAALQAWFGLDAGYLATCGRELKWGESSVAPIDLERVAKIASLCPTADGSIREVSLRLARKGRKLGAHNPEYAPWHSMTLGMAEYRSGHFKAADEALRFAEKTSSGGSLAGTAAFYRAMSLFKQGQTDEAQALFAATKAWTGPCPNETAPLPVSIDHDNLIMWLAYREASALIEAAPETTDEEK